jgi:NADH:ubiquinone oxidoreductase subunit 2 (subunit N)
MKKLLFVIALVLLASVFVGCFTTPIAATSNPVGSKTGSASCMYVLSIFPLGDWDTGVYKAAKNGGISRISTVDSKMQFFYIVSIVTTVVTGE